MTTRIKVGIRLRPFLDWEEKKGYENSRIEVDHSTKEIKVIEDPKKPRKAFKFDYVFGEDADQNTVYTGSNIDSLLKKAADGYHCTLFAYGQTGSGKTHTMEGYEYEMENTYKDSKDEESLLNTGAYNLATPMNRPKPKAKQDANRYGIVPRAINRLFTIMKEKSGQNNFNISCSFLQIYNEKIFDLLNPSTMRQRSNDGETTLSPGLRLRWTAQDQFQVENLFVFDCQNAEEVMSYYNYGIKNRFTASHKLNMASSRSHTIMTLRIETIDPQTQSSSFSRIQLVDLAGSERIGQTGTEGKLAKESIDINKSLFILRQVISTLSEIHRASKSKDGNIPHIPYRESKLTSLLKQSIGGNSYCLMLACINPCDDFFDENLSTLNYATKATYIKNEPVLNNDPKTNVISNLRSDVKTLRLELDRANEHIAFLSNLTGASSKLKKPHPPTCCSATCRYGVGAGVGDIATSRSQNQQQYDEDEDNDGEYNNEDEDGDRDQMDTPENEAMLRQIEEHMKQNRSLPMVSETATNFATLNHMFRNSPGIVSKQNALQQQVKKLENRSQLQQPAHNQENYDQFSDRLMESITMVRDLLANNKELREQTDLANKKVEISERDLYFLQRENQDLRDRLQNTSKQQEAQQLLEDDSKSALQTSQISNWSRFSKQDIIQEVLTLRQEKRVLERKLFGTEIESQFNNGKSEYSGIKSLTQSPNLNHLQKRRNPLDTPKKMMLSPVNVYTTNNTNSSNRKISNQESFHNHPSSVNSFTAPIPQDGLASTNFGRSHQNTVRQSLTYNPLIDDPSIMKQFSPFSTGQQDGSRNLQTLSPPKRRVQSQAPPSDTGDEISRPASLQNTNGSNRSSSSSKQNQKQQPGNSYHHNNPRPNNFNNSFQY